MRTLLGFALLAQVLDGVLTYIGLVLGYAELNPIVNYLIGIVGLIPALVVVKVFASTCSWYLYQCKCRYFQLAVVVITYTFGVIPWIVILIWRL